MTFTTAAEVRAACRAGTWTTPTPGLAMGFVQANLVMLPRDWAFDFLLYCRRNAQPCPLLDVTDPGDFEPRDTAPGSDLRTDLPAYRVWQSGELINEPTDVLSYSRDDLVSFLIGCSFTFENALLAAKLPVRHIEEGRNVPMYKTNIACRPAGRFHGPMVVSMRPMTATQYTQAAAISAKMPLAHGAPIHFGDPADIGIRDIHQPDFGDSVTIHDHEQPAFWACGVTPQAALMAAKPPFAITHKPGHMFLTDLRDEDLVRG
ncbi:MAG: putative hydro-lyase [Fimbriiglobus sp.]